jgi:hypothetical protein
MDSRQQAPPRRRVGPARDHRGRDDSVAQRRRSLGIEKRGHHGLEWDRSRNQRERRTHGRLAHGGQSKLQPPPHTLEIQHLGQSFRAGCGLGHSYSTLNQRNQRRLLASNRHGRTRPWDRRLARSKRLRTRPRPRVVEPLRRDRGRPPSNPTSPPLKTCAAAQARRAKPGAKRRQAGAERPARQGGLRAGVGGWCN